MAKTYFHRNTALATGLHITGPTGTDHEYELATTAGSSQANDDQFYGGGQSAIHVVWTTPSGEPNNADWPAGEYRCILDCTAAGADITYGLRAAGTETGHFARVSSDLATEIETGTMTTALFSGTGVKTGVRNTDWTAGSTGDRFECAVAAVRLASHGSQGLSIAVNAPDADVTNGGISDGPWTEGQPERNGSGTASLAAVAATGAGEPVVSGSGTGSLAAIGSAGIGGVVVGGSGTADLSPVAAAGAGIVPIDGAGTADLVAIAAAGTGNVEAAGSINGSGTANLLAVAASGVGDVIVAGAGSANLLAVLADGTGDVDVAGSGTATLGPAAASGGGFLNVAPNAPTLVSPVDDGTFDPAGTQTFDWTFSDPNAGDTQSAWALRRLAS